MGLLLMAMALLASCASQPVPWESPEGTWFTHPNVLKDPVNVSEVLSESELVLEDGRRIRLEKPFSMLDRMKGRPVEVITRSKESDGFIKADLIIAGHFIICGYKLPSDVWVRRRLAELERN